MINKYKIIFDGKAFIKYSEFTYKNLDYYYIFFQIIDFYLKKSDII